MYWTGEEEGQSKVCCCGGFCCAMLSGRRSWNPAASAAFAFMKFSISSLVHWRTRGCPKEKLWLVWHQKEGWSWCSGHWGMDDCSCGYARPWWFEVEFPVHHHLEIWSNTDYCSALMSVTTPLWFIHWFYRRCPAIDAWTWCGVRRVVLWQAHLGEEQWVSMGMIIIWCIF